MALVNCVECKREISDQAVVCPHCGHPSPRRSSARLWEIAYRQKLVLYSILLNLACLVVSVLPSVPPAIILLISLAGVVFAIWTFYKLGRALTVSIIWIVVGIVCLFIPLLALVVLFMMNSKATAVLQAAGVRVGLMGANLRKLERPTSDATTN